MKTTTSSIYTQQAGRPYIQYGGPEPDKPLKLAGADTSEVQITGVTRPEGDVTAINSYDPYKRFRYRRVARSTAPPDFTTGTLEFHNKAGSHLLKQLKKQRCPLNFYVAYGLCRDLSNFDEGWDMLYIGSWATVTETDMGDLNAFESDDATGTNLSLSLEEVYQVSPLYFDEGTEETSVGSGTVGFADGAFAPSSSCRECGMTDGAGDQWVYTVTSGNTASAPTPIDPTLYYSTNGGVSWTEAGAIGSGIDTAVALKVVGGYVVILGKDFSGSGFWYAKINSLGVPGAFTKVTTGFGIQTMQDMYVLSPSEIFVVGNQGIILKSNNFKAGITETVSAGTITTQTLTAIDGVDDTIVIVGAIGTILKSEDRGVTFSTVTGPIATALYSVEVKDKYHWWIGSTAAQVYYTLTGGVSWTAVTISGLAGPVYDIVFATSECGYAVGTSSIVATVNGGYTWTNGVNRLVNVPTTGQMKFVAVPEGADSDVAAGVLVVGGVDAGGTDAVVFVARSSEF